MNLFVWSNKWLDKKKKNGINLNKKIKKYINRFINILI